MAETLAQKAEARRRLDVEIACAFLADSYHEFSIQAEWARRVLENEQKAVAKAVEK